MNWKITESAVERRFNLPTRRRNLHQPLLVCHLFRQKLFDEHKLQFSIILFKKNKQHCVIECSSRFFVSLIHFIVTTSSKDNSELQSLFFLFKLRIICTTHQFQHLNTATQLAKNFSPNALSFLVPFCFAVQFIRTATSKTCLKPITWSRDFSFSSFWSCSNPNKQHLNLFAF